MRTMRSLGRKGLSVHGQISEWIITHLACELREREKKEAVCISVGGFVTQVL